MTRYQFERWDRWLKRTGWAALAGIALLVSCLTGCAGATPTQRALTGLDLGRDVLNLADSLIVSSCTTAKVQAAPDPSARADACLKAQAAQRAAVAGWEIALHGVVASTDEEGGLNLSTMSGFIGPLAEAYPDLAGLVEEISGRDLPPLSKLIGDLLQ